MVKRIRIYDETSFNEKSSSKHVVHDSPFLKIVNHNFKAGQELPVHSEDVDGQVSIVVIDGIGDFLEPEGRKTPIYPGDVLVADIREPHGIRAKSDLRILMTTVIK